MGTSASLFDDDTMLIGSPGPYTWRGVIFVTSFLEDYLKRDKTMYYSRHEEEAREKLDDEKLKKYSYLGKFSIHLFQIAVDFGSYSSKGYV